MRTWITVSLLSFAVALAGCNKEAPAPPAPGGSSSPAQSAAHDHKPGEENAHGHGQQTDAHVGEGGPAISLGSTVLNGMSVQASRDQGDLKPGGDVPVDVWIDGGLGGVTAVRFWIGAQDAKGSVKAKAEVENGKWHTHAQVPDPLPADSRLWVEIEGKDGKKSVVSFDLMK